MEKKIKNQKFDAHCDLISKGFCGCVKKPCEGKNKEICLSVKK
jgi:hypothetical protein